MYHSCNFNGFNNILGKREKDKERIDAFCNERLRASRGRYKKYYSYDILSFAVTLPCS